MTAEPSRRRGGNGVFVTATDTGVGKTFLSALLVAVLRKRSIQAGYMKPVATGVRGGFDGETPEDVEFVLRLAGVEGPPDDLCPERLEAPAAPWVAAREAGTRISVARILAARERMHRRYPFLVVEGAGGVLVPLTEILTVLDLMKEMGYPVLVAARPGLGTINHTLLTLEALQRRSIPVAGFVTNGAFEAGDRSVSSSPEVIERFSGVRFLGHVPWCPHPGRLLSEWIPYLDKTLRALGLESDGG